MQEGPFDPEPAGLQAAPAASLVQLVQLVQDAQRPATEKQNGACAGANVTKPAPPPPPLVRSPRKAAQDALGAQAEEGTTAAATDYPGAASWKPGRAAAECNAMHTTVHSAAAARCPGGAGRTAKPRGCN